MDIFLGSLKMAIHSLMSPLFKEGAQSTSAFLGRLSETGQGHLLWVRMILAGGLGSFVGFLMARDAARPVNGLLHMEGRQLKQGKSAVQTINKKLAPQIKAMGGDYFIHDEIQLTREQFSKHGFYIGAPGSGKTTALLKLIRQIFAKNHKALIHDSKGDYTAKFPGGMLIAPWDARGSPWLVALDVRDKQGAEEFAALIPVDEKQPMWGNAARQVFVGMIVDLQQRKGLTWGWKDLYQQLTISDDAVMEEIMDRCNPLGKAIFSGAEVTTAGILINLKADLAWIANLADAWGNPDGKNGFSLIDWLMNEKPKNPQLILVNNARYSRMVKGYSTAMMSLLNSRMNSPEFDDSRDRILWLIFDELPQLGRIPNIETYIEMGRSKGVRFWGGFQNISQMYEIYKKQLTDSLLSMVGTLVVCQVGPGETAEAVHKIMGKRTVERKNISVSGSGAGQSTTLTTNRDTIDIIHISDLSTRIGNKPELGGVLAYYVSNESTEVNELLWKWDQTPKLRPAYVPSPWASGIHVPKESEEEAYAKQLDVQEKVEGDAHESAEMEAAQTEEAARRAAQREEFLEGAMRAAQRRFNEKSGGSTLLVAAEKKVKAASNQEDLELAKAAVAGKDGLTAQDYQRALASQELANQGGFAQLVAAQRPEEEEESLAVSAADAHHHGESLARAMGMGHEAQHALGVAFVAGAIADEVFRPGPTNDPIELRKRQQAIERARGRPLAAEPDWNSSR
jgi:hypothetical protein